MPPSSREKPACSRGVTVSRAAPDRPARDSASTRSHNPCILPPPPDQVAGGRTGQGANDAGRAERQRDAAGRAGRRALGSPVPPGHVDRPLRHPATARSRCDGRGVRRIRPRARPQGRAQVPATGRHRGNRLERAAGPAPPRSQGHGPHLAPQCRDALPGGHRSRGVHLPGDGAGRRRIDERVAQGRQARVARDRGRALPGRRRPGGRAPRGHDPPRLQDRQRPGP